MHIQDETSLILKGIVSDKGSLRTEDYVFKLGHLIKSYIHIWTYLPFTPYIYIK